MDIPLYFFIAYNDLDRLSPAGADTTLKALDLVEYDSEDIAILDIGCGVGDKTILLANYFENSTVEAIDLFKHYLKVLDEKIKENNLSNRVYTYQMDMHDLDFPNEEFDIVFANASAEIIGFKNALRQWKRLLKPNGYLIVSDISWLKSPSVESKRFWKNNYGEVDSIENKISQIGEDYEFVGHVVVPKSDWKEYYNKLEANLNSLSSDESAKDFVAQLKKEMNVYRQNSDDYSYVYYVLRIWGH